MRSVYVLALMFLPTLVLGAEPHARIKASAGESLAAARDQARAARGATTQPVIIELAGGTYVLNTARDAAAMVRRVDHPSLGMLYDTF